MPPKTLHRLPYLVRWLALVVGVGLVAALITPLADRALGENLSLALFFVLIVGVLLFKILAMDIPRIHSIGWSPWLLLLFLVPVVGGIMQILLFVMPPKAA